MRTNQIFRRSLSLLLCLCMLLSLGVTAFATVGVETRASASDFASNKKLTNGGDSNAESYTIDIDAIVNGSTSDSVVGTPTDVAIVFDRSDSMSYYADPSLVRYFNSYAEVQTFLNGLDKNKYGNGYYRVSNISESGGRFYSAYQGVEQYTSWEPLFYRNNRWETYVTEYQSGTYEEGPHGIVPSSSHKYSWYYGEWRDMQTAFNTFNTRKGVIGYTSAKFAIAVPRLTMAQMALESFVNSLNDSASNLPAGQYHTVSITSYGGTVFKNGYTLDGGTFYESYSQQMLDMKCSYPSIQLAGSRATAAQNNAKNSFIKDIIYNQYTWSVTRTDKAIEEIQDKNFLPAKTAGRNRVVIVLTDGVPTSGMVFMDNIANGAITAAKKLKDDSVTVFALSFMKGISPGTGCQPQYTTGSDNDKAHNFLHLISSNYPGATSVTNFGTQAKNEYWMADNGNGNDLIGHLKAILEKSVTSFKTPLTGTNESVSIYDEITREFKIDESKPIKVYVQKYNGNGSYGAKSYIGSHSVKNSADWNGTNVSNVYKLYWDCALNSGNPAQSGVDLDISSVRLNWLDAKYAAIREKDYKNDNSAYPDYKKGYKIGMEIPIVVDRNNTLGGNNINTNTNKSGLYGSTTNDSGNQPNFNKNYIKYPVPNANVQATFVTQVFDYFMDLLNLIDNQGAGVNSAFAKEIFASMLEDIKDLLDTLDNNKNDYVDISIALENLYSLIAKAHADTFTANGAQSGASFDFTLDQILDVLVTLHYTSSNVDSIGVAPFKDVTTTLHPNYYGPKYVVVDFDETVKTPLDKEGGLAPKLQSGVTNGKIEGTNICYNFRSNYTSGNKSFLEKNYTTVKYQVTAINAPKAQKGNKTVARNFYVIPANVMTYDDTLLTFDNKGWETVGTFSDGEQSHDNAVIHGFDSLYNSTYSQTYYHNALKAVTVSKTKGVAQATFTINGTGFDIFSQTSPNAGMMAVEVSKDSTFSTDIKTFIVDTYLKDATLNQIPVVRCDDLSYGTYYIRITAFYDSIFDHNYVSQWKNGVLTEEKLRERYGIPADADFTFIPSASGYNHGATRIANATNGQYNVYVDGIRVYNTLGTVSSNKVANFAYKLAGEGYANILNVNDALVDASNANNWAATLENESANGILYMAAGNSTSDQAAVTDGIILGMEGALYTKQNGTKFYVYKNAELTTNVKYNGKNVYYRIQEITSPNGRKYQGLNYYYDGGSNTVPMTKKEIEAAFGGMPTYYNAKYSQYGPEKEVYLSGYNGVAFKIGKGATKVMISFKSINGKPAYVQFYDHSVKKFKTLTITTSPVEMYYDITKYVSADGYVYIRNANPTVDGVRQNGITAICNIKYIGTVTKGITVDAELIRKATEIFGNAELPLDEAVEIKHSLNLASDISLNYAVATDKLAEYDSSYLSVELNGVTYELEPQIRGEYGYFTLEGLTAVNMNDKAYATLHMFFGEEEFVSETDVYSVADYAYAQLAKAEASAELKAVCANLLRYGAEAQSFKGYKTEELADAAMTEEYKSYLTDLDAVVIENKAQALADVDNGIAWAGKALVLDSKVAVKAVFNLKGFAGNKEDLNLRVSYKNAKGEEVTLIIDSIEAYNADAEQYAFVVDTLLAADMRSVLTMALYEGDTQVSETQIYSVESYCFGKTGALADLGKALLAYSDAAKTFFAK